MEKLKNSTLKTINDNGEVVEVKEFSPISKKYMTPAGKKLQPVYKREYSEKFKKNIVVKSGEQDIYEFIQASASSTDLEILKREAVSSGIEANVLPNAVYGIDTSIYPKNIHDLYRLSNNAKAIYDKYDDDTKAAFIDVNDFTESVVKGNAQTRIINYYKKIAEAKAAAIAEAEKGKE